MAKQTKARVTGGRTKTAGQRRKRKPARRSATAASGRELKLDLLRRQIERALKKLSKADRKRYKTTQLRMKTWMADIDTICDPENPDGCGPIMVFPS